MDGTAGEIVWRPSERVKAEATLTGFMAAHGIADYDALLKRSAEDPEWYWAAAMEWFGVSFSTPYEKLMDTSRGLPWTRWCVGGKSNLVATCLDRHAGTPTMQAEAIVWVGEDGEVRRWTFQELTDEVGRMANALTRLGIGAGDAVALYMPMVPEVMAAFLAVEKIGAVSVPLFSGFGAQACATRMNDGEVKAAITVDATLRRGKPVAMKATLDEAAKQCPTLKHTVVVRRLGTEVPWDAARDRWWHELTAQESPEAPTRAMDADAMAVLVYTSGTTGKPKGVVLTHVGLPTKVAVDLGLVMDLKAGDVAFWMSDFGWLTGPIVSTACTMLGATLLMAEGAPDWPDAGRMWRLIDEHRVTYFGIAPTAVRAQMQHGEAVLAGRDLSSIRVFASTGEPWNPDSWLWLFDKVGKRRLPILNYCGGTEISGGIVGCTVLHPQKPCCFSGSMPGMAADVVDDDGRSVPRGQVGELAMRVPSIGLTRSLWRDDERYLDSYWRRIPDLWVHGDFASVDADGFWYVHGRSDDTLKISGKRTGPAEIEAILHATGRVAEAAVVGVPDPVKGQAVICACVPAKGENAGPELAEALSKAVVEGHGSSFRPKEVVFVSDLPKTRTMKVMRRLVRSSYLGQPTGDTSSLVNPEVVEELKARFAGRSTG